MDGAGLLYADSIRTGVCMAALRMQQKLSTLCLQGGRWPHSGRGAMESSAGRQPAGCVRSVLLSCTPTPPDALAWRATMVPAHPQSEPTTLSARSLQTTPAQRSQRSANTPEYDLNSGERPVRGHAGVQPRWRIVYCTVGKVVPERLLRHPCEKLSSGTTSGSPIERQEEPSRFRHCR